MFRDALTHFFTRHSISKQFRNLFVLIVALPLLLVAIIASVLSVREMASGYEHLSVSKATQVRTILATTSASVNEIYTYLRQDDELQAIFRGEKDTDTLHTAMYLYSGFQDMFRRSTAISQLRLYLDPELMVSDSSISSFYPVTDEIREEDWYDIASSSQAAFWKSEKRVDRGVTYYELNYYAQIPLPFVNSSGILVITVSNTYLWNLVEDSNYSICLNVNEGPVFFSSDSAYLGEPFPAYTDDTYYYEESGPMTISGKGQVASVQTMRPTASNDRIHVLVFNPLSYRHITSMALIFTLIALLVIAICALIFYSYSRYSAIRVQTLRDAMHKAANNDYEIIDAIQGDDELSETFQDLKETINTLKANQAEIYESKLNEQRLVNEQQETELKLLASQINPHFLYNTLEMLRMKALSDGNREVANAIKLLGKNMRYVLGTTRTSSTTLDREIDYVSAYLAIMKMRFDERLSYQIDVEPSLDPARYRILPLLIQPLAENAILHGIEESGQHGNVFIRIKRFRASDLLIEVTDTGCGMTAEKVAELERLLKGKHPDTAHGVGLYNVNYRVRLYYGEEYGLSIESTPGRGTTMRIVLPLQNVAGD